MKKFLVTVLIISALTQTVFADDIQEIRKSAEQGNAQAQYNLGVCYAKGNGVTKDYAEAVKWFRKAAVQGHQNAKKVLQRLGLGETW